MGARPTHSEDTAKRAMEAILANEKGRCENVSDTMKAAWKQLPFLAAPCQSPAQTLSGICGIR